MVDSIGGLAAAGEAIKLARELNSIDRDLDRAELKIRLVEVIDKLLEAKEALQDAKGREQDLLQEIASLKLAAQNNAKFRHDGKGRMFEVMEDGRDADMPYCSTCFIRDEKLYPMKRQDKELGYHSFWCFNCRRAYYD